MYSSIIVYYHIAVLFHSRYIVLLPVCERQDIGSGENIYQVQGVYKKKTFKRHRDHHTHDTQP